MNWCCVKCGALVAVAQELQRPLRTPFPGRVRAQLGLHEGRRRAGEGLGQVCNVAGGGGDSWAHGGQPANRTLAERLNTQPPLCIRIPTLPCTHHARPTPHHLFPHPHHYRYSPPSPDPPLATTQVGACRRSCGACEVCQANDRACYNRNRERQGYLVYEPEELFTGPHELGSGSGAGSGAGEAVRAQALRSGGGRGRGRSRGRAYEEDDETAY